MEPTVEERVRKVLMEQGGYAADKIVPEARLFEDLDLDSLDGVDLVIQLEQEFVVEVTDEEAAAVKTVGDIHRLFDKYMPKAS